MIIYNVYHIYDVDGGFGDAVGNETLVATFSDKAKAEEFVNKYSNPHVYDEPYAELECRVLKIREQQIDVVPKKEDMWWLEEKDDDPFIMIDKIKAMGLDVSIIDGDVIAVKGDNNKLQNVRQMLNNEGYIDDTAIACRMFKETPATDFISRILICQFGSDNKGYMAMATGDKSK